MRWAGVQTTKPVGSHKKKGTRTGVFLFGAALLLRKSARLRAGDLTCKGNPTKVSLAYIPFLAIYRSAHGQQNLWAITKKYDHPLGGRIFLERRFCAAKSVACGRVIEREWGNPQRVPPHTPPSLRYARVRTTKPEGNHKKKNHPLGGFSFWNAAGRMELAASTCAKRVKSRGEGRAPANGSAIRGMPGSEFEPRLFCCAEHEK